MLSKKKLKLNLFEQTILFKIYFLKFDYKLVVVIFAIDINLNK